MCHMLCTKFINVLLKVSRLSIWKISVSHLVLCLRVIQDNPIPVVV